MNRIVINTDLGEKTINRHIYGHFAEHLGRCIYDGIWVGEDSEIPNTRGIRDDVVELLRKIKTPNLRWPGGCFADDYHWRDGIGPKEQRPRTVNMHWGHVVENNHFGTHEFMDLCEQLDCEPYICGNVGSGTPEEMRDWVEYMTYPEGSTLADLRRSNGREEPWQVKFWGIGNENWGCGGLMRPEYYVDLYRRFQIYIRNYGDNKIYKIASGMGGVGPESTEVLMRDGFKLNPWNSSLNAISLHYYAFFLDQDVPATGFGEDQWFKVLQSALKIDSVIAQHTAIMDRYDPEKRVGLIVDEWGAWYPVEPGMPKSGLYQQNTLRDALLAGATFHIFHEHCDRVQMANIAQTVNVLQAMILTEGEKLLVTPTYHVFEMYAVHQDATLLPMDIECPQYTFDGESIPAVSASASRNQDGVVHITLCNLDPNTDLDITCDLRGGTVAEVSGRILTADDMTAHNTFESPDVVHPVAFEGVELEQEKLLVKLPAKSVVVLAVKMA